MLAVYMLGLHPASVGRLDGEEVDLMLAGYRWRWNQNVRLIAAALTCLVRVVVGPFSEQARNVRQDQLEDALPHFRDADPLAPPDIDPDLVPDSR